LKSEILTCTGVRRKCRSAQNDITRGKLITDGKSHGIKFQIMTTENIIFIEEIIVILLLIASGVAVVTRRLRVPYTVGLVIIGLVITLLSPQHVKFTPQIIMLLLVPPLVFEAAFHIRFDDLRRDFWLILLLAIPGVILTMLLVGWLVSWGTGLALQAALVFGALIAATDPVAVVDLFRRLGAPRRLQVLLESESLLNDGTAIVMFGLMLTTALQGRFDARQSITQFITVSGGGVMAGLILGMSISQLTKRIDDPLVETALTTALAFGSYLLAETFHVSGVLAVVTAGIISGNTSQETMSASTRLVVNNFWEYAAFIANSFIFLLIGLTIDLNILFENWQAIAWAILAALLARVVSTYGFSSLRREIPPKWKHVLFWGGLRGAITLALALSLPEEGIFIAERGRLQAMAFGVVLFTLLVQGFSMDWLVKRLKLIVRSPAQSEYELRHARFVAGRSGYDYLRRRSQEGMISEHTWQKLSELLKKKNDMLMDEVKQVMTSEPEVEAEEFDTAYREALRAQRTALSGLLHDGVITEQTYSQLIGEVDEALMDKKPSARLVE
jgi:monovalent cation:H+ antiporter, CPA1 family